MQGFLLEVHSVGVIPEQKPWKKRKSLGPLVTKYFTLHFKRMISKNYPVYPILVWAIKTNTIIYILFC